MRSSDTIAARSSTQSCPNSRPRLLKEETWHETPEIYSPETQTWREATNHSTPRVYHSFALLLLPDASVLVGEGGLRFTRPNTSYFDAQIYYPPYLFTPDGKDFATQPKVKFVTPISAKAGETLTITTDTAVDGASLVRFSRATHSPNNDQKRIKLALVKASAADFKYSAKISGDTGVALPGYWMLFVLANGVLSKSQSVQIRIV